MSESRATEIMSISADKSQSRPTEIMGNIETDNFNHSHITIGTMVGEGYIIEGIIAENTGEATIFTCSKNNEKYVAKVYHRYKKPNVDILNIIKSIDSPYVIKILGDGEVQGRYFEILPFYEKGDLQSTLPENDFIRNIFIPYINEGLRAIHEKGIVHRDIKPNNIFYGNHGQTIVIGDFGISSQLNAGISYKLTSTSRTAGYAAPEVYNGIVSKEVDYYSLGITLLHLLLQGDPFEGLNDQQIYIMTCVKSIEIPSYIDKNMVNLIKGLTLKDRANRWGYNEIKKWLNNEYVEINDGIKQRDSVLPYKFIDDNEYFEMADLMIAFAQNWEEGKKHLYRGYLKRHMEDDFKNYGANICSKVEDCMEEKNQDLGLLKLIYALNPNAPLCWKGRIFGDVTSFVDAVLEEFPNVGSYFEEALRLGIISHYLEVRGNNEDIIKLAKEFETEENRETAFFKMIYLLDPSKPLHWRGAVYNSLDSLSEAIGKVYHSRNKNKNVKELLLSGALEYFLKVNDLNQLSSRISKIRSNFSEEYYNKRALFHVIYELNPNALFYFYSRGFKDTLELYKALMKEPQEELIFFVKDIIVNKNLYHYLILNNRDDFAEKINALNNEENQMYAVFKFMNLLNPDSKYYFEGKTLVVEDIGKEILDIDFLDNVHFPEKASYYVKILDTIGDYYCAIGRQEVGNRLIELKAKNNSIVKAAMDGNLANDLNLKGRDFDLAAKLLFNMLYIIDSKAPLWWKGKIYKGIDDLVDDALNDMKQSKHSQAYEILSTGSLSYYFRVKGLTDEADVVSGIEKLSPDAYACLSSLIIQYRPNAPLIIDGNSVAGILELKELLTRSFNKLIDNSRTEGPQLKRDLEVLLKNDLLYKKVKASIDNTDNEARKHLDWLKNISKLARSNSDSAFWRLYFELIEKKVLYYEGKEVASVEELVDTVIEKDALGIINESKVLLKDSYFKEWLRSLGFVITT
ncbi:MAG: protein kinase [Tissierellales bacterium]